MKKYDAIIIGGGFFGLSVAMHLAKELKVGKILVIEKETDFMQHASYNNQARVHNGYHYPRSLLTGVRSRLNLPTFVEEYPEAVDSSFDKYYAVAKSFSKVSARQFQLFSKRIGAEISSAPKQVKELFNPYLIEDVFLVKEYAFNSAILKKNLLTKLEQLPVDILSGKEVAKVAETNNGELNVLLGSGDIFAAPKVFNCTYSLINSVNTASGLPVVPLKHELVEMCLVKLPEEIKDISVTVMDGPFFSFMPFPDRKLTTLSHVRYTPHSEWSDTKGSDLRNGHEYLNSLEKVSHFPQMITDVSRYMPVMKKAQYADSLWEVKTVLPKSETDDSRPILFKENYSLRGYTLIMGGKIDNIYDVYKELDVMYAAQ